MLKLKLHAINIIEKSGMFLMREQIHYLDACVFLLSFREFSREFVDNVESLRDSESACCTPQRTIDIGFSATLE